MALGLILRRASSSILPLAIRAVGSQSAFRSAVSSALCVEKNALAREIGQRGLLPFARFSTATADKQRADKNLIHVLEDEIEAALQEPKDVEECPDDFPFEIQDIPGERTVLLTRKYQDEEIKVEVDMPNVEPAEDDDNVDQDDDSSAPSSIPLVVRISKGSGQCLEFGVTAFADEITIDSLSVKGPESSEDQLAYEGPDFSDLDENLQKAFHKYLEIRGIKPSTTNFLFDYMQKKDSKEYFQWLNNLKNFMEK